MNGTDSGILLVEDDDDHVGLIRRAFESQAPHVNLSVANTLEEARNTLTDEIPDVLITDLCLPDGQGSEFLNVQDEERSFPVVIMTGHGDEQAAVDAMRAGAFEYVVKSPTTLSDLPRIADSAIREWQNILARQQAEEALRSAKEFTDNALNALHDVFYAFDTNEKLVYWNRRFSALTGYEDDEIRERRIVDFIRREDRRRLLAAVDTVRTQGVAHVEVMVLTKDGRQIPHEFSGSLLKDSEGKTVGMCGCGRDLTERKRAERIIREKDDQIRHKQRMEAVGSLAGGIAHEFNNLLQIIQGYTRFVADEFPHSDRRHQDLSRVLTAADRAAMLTRQLLNFSRREELDPKRVDPNRIIQNLVTMLRHLIGEHIQVDVLLGDSIGEVHADPALLEQALVNLCVNARDAMASGGRLTIRSDAYLVDDDAAEEQIELIPGKYARIRISDTGTGMPAEVRERIFEPFFTTKQPGEGTGLGLAMVYGVISQHRGVIDVESEVGRGTTFTILLPITDAAEHNATVKDHLPPGGAETILIAEDEPLVRAVAARILRSAGYTPVTAEDGEEALQVFQEQGDRIDLILLDAVMPKMSGRQAYERIRRLDPHMKVAFCTGYDPERNPADLAGTEGVEIITKPFNAEQLLTFVRRILNADATLRYAAK